MDLPLEVAIMVLAVSRHSGDPTSIVVPLPFIMLRPFRKSKKKGKGKGGKGKGGKGKGGKGKGKDKGKDKGSLGS